MLDLVGTVFREPILCRNIPRIVPGNSLDSLIIVKVGNILLELLNTCPILRLEKTHMYW